MQNANAKFSKANFPGFLIMAKVVSLVLYNLHSRRFKYILQLLTCIYALDLFYNKKSNNSCFQERVKSLTLSL